MTTLNINGRRVTVDDSFLSLSPDQQNATVEEIAKSLGGGAGETRQSAYQETANDLSAMTRGIDKPLDSARNSTIGKLDSAVRGAADTLTFGMADELSAWLASKTGIGGQSGDYESNLAAQRRTDQSDEENRPGYRIAGQLGGAVVGGAGLARAGLSPTALSIEAGWSLPKVAAASAIEGAGIGALQGFGSGEGINDRLSQAQTGAEFGAMLGAATPLAVAGGSKVARKAISPFVTSPERSAAVNVLESEGIPLTAGQRTGSKGLRYAESEIGGERAAQIIDDQGRAFTDAAMQKAGGSGLADPENLAGLKGRLGAGFDAISGRNTLQADGPFLRDFVETLREYNRVLPSEQKSILGNIASDIGKRIQSGKGKLSGEDYQMYRSRLTKRANNARGKDNELSDAYKGLRNALDDAMDRSIAPADAGEWATLRRQYRNYKVLNKASLGGGEEAGLGVISPARLRMAASSGNADAFATGSNDYTKLAKAGQAVMTPLPNSGTASRLNVRNLGAMAPSIVGAGAGSAYGAQEGGVYGAVTGALAGLLAPKAIGRLMMTKGGQRYLANQIMRTNLPGPEKKAIVNAIATFGGSSAAARLASP